MCGCRHLFLQVQDAVSVIKAANAPTDSAAAAISMEAFELRRMPRIPVKPSLENGMQVRPDHVLARVV